MTRSIKEHACALAFGVPTVVGVAASSVSMPGWTGPLLGVVICMVGAGGAVTTMRRV